MSERIQAAFDQIHAENELKDKTRQLLENTRAVQTQTRSFQNRRSPSALTQKHVSYRRLAATMAIFVLVIGISGWTYLTPVSAISIDINPSIELGINRYDRVITVDSYNDDGARLALDLHVINKNYTDAVEQILSDTTIAELLENDEQMDVTVVSNNNAKSSQILSNLEHCTAHTENISCHASSSSEAAEAHSHGLPLAKYRAYLELQTLKPDIQPEDLQDMTMRQIRDLIQSLSDGDADPTPDGTDEAGETEHHEETEPDHPGNGYHNGNGHHGNGHH